MLNNSFKCELIAVYFFFEKNIKQSNIHLIFFVKFNKVQRKWFFLSTPSLFFFCICNQCYLKVKQKPCLVPKYFAVSFDKRKRHKWASWRFRTEEKVNVDVTCWFGEVFLVNEVNLSKNMDLFMLLGIASALLVVLIATWLFTRKSSPAENKTGELSSLSIDRSSMFDFNILLQRTHSHRAE